MSGSPKYSSVRVSSVYAQQEASRRRRQAASRREQEQRRARERAELAARRARERQQRQERERAEDERRKAELAARRAAEQQDRERQAHQQRARVEARRLGEVAGLLDRTSASAAELAPLQRTLAELRERAERGEPLGDDIEGLRGRVVLLRSAGESARNTDRAGVLAELERQLAEVGDDGATHDAPGRQRCVELLAQLRAATGPNQEVAFEALLGTVEHSLVRHGTAAAHAVQLERLRADARAAERAAAEQAEREQAQALEAAQAEVAEVADRLGVVRPGAEAVADRAAALGDHELSARVGDALRTATEGLSTRHAPAARTAVEALERLLPEVEVQLDELELAHTRRMDLAQALRDAMTDEGFAFTGGEEQGESLLLRFERPSGATYDATVATGSDGSPVLVYRVDGEPDMTLHQAAEGAVCDRTEDLLERVHEAISADDGFVPGELTWQGKPPGRREKSLPDNEAWRWTT